MTEPSCDECLIEAELRARAAHSEPHRHYHNELHLDECLAELQQVDGISEKERRLLRWAILWHDSVYEPGLRENETRSADLASTELQRCGVADEEIAEVARLVRLTEHHRPEANDARGALLVSIDLAILGSTPERYRAYVDAVRREYAHVPEPLWRAGRAEVLKRLLSREPLFPDPGFRARLEAQARSNMEAELRRLGED
jgi:predicted metal-dependent HD superfamily phosphohydrolase